MGEGAHSVPSGYRHLTSVSAGSPFQELIKAHEEERLSIPPSRCISIAMQNHKLTCQFCDSFDAKPKFRAHQRNDSTDEPKQNGEAEQNGTK